jgi:hypothetical protein
MAKLSKDGINNTGSNLHPRESISGAATFASGAAVLNIACDGCSSFTLYWPTGLAGAITMEGSIDNANWFGIPVRIFSAPGGLAALQSTATSANLWIGNCQHFNYLRARCSTYTSGSSVITLAAHTSIYGPEVFHRPSDLHVTATGASGAAVTLTLAAPGTGLFHHITRIRIERHPAALLTAAATPVIVTTTNLPGSRVFSIPADAAAQGVVFAQTVEPSAPIKSSVANTATTVVAPVTTSVIWRLSADYYAAP